jgi:hypothetical protein
VAAINGIVSFLVLGQLNFKGYPAAATSRTEKWMCSVEVVMSAKHAVGLRFDLGRNHFSRQGLEAGH